MFCEEVEHETVELLRLFEVQMMRGVGDDRLSRAGDPRHKRVCYPPNFE